MKTTVSIKMQLNPFYILSQKKQSCGGSTCILQSLSSAGGTKEGSNGKKYGEIVNVHFDARIQFKQLVCDCTFQKDPNGMNK